MPPKRLSFRANEADHERALQGAGIEGPGRSRPQARQQSGEALAVQARHVVDVLGAQGLDQGRHALSFARLLNVVSFQPTPPLFASRSATPGTLLPIAPITLPVIQRRASMHA